MKRHEPVRCHFAAFQTHQIMLNGNYVQNLYKGKKGWASIQDMLVGKGGPKLLCT